MYEIEFRRRYNGQKVGDVDIGTVATMRVVQQSVSLP